jgi:cytochrome c oxidase accessory protein FixG
MSQAPQATEQVLPTLNADGSRRWVDPVLSKGAFWRRRLAVAWGLIALFVALPFLRVGGKPVILLDLPRREFTFGGHTLLATDTVLLMLFLLSTFLAIFWLSALLGRAWCGWGCPQTVYLEFVFRPIERWLEGPRAHDLRRPRTWRTGLKWAVYAALAVALANVFLAYFVRTETLWRWLTHPPSEHPAGFAVVALTSVLMFIDFAWFREQMCVVTCPYARLQSVLLDQRSLVVAYDPHRGEPRGKLRKLTDLSLGQRGDCIDCHACVRTCPTGIDIRNGLQMECIACTQCADACDAIMDRIDKSRGLIRYAARQEIEEQRTLSWRQRFLRPRTILYPAVIGVLAVLFVAVAWRQRDADITLLRGIGAPFAEMGDGKVQNALRLKIHNRTEQAHTYRVRLVDAPELELIVPPRPIEVAPGMLRTEGLFVLGQTRDVGKLRKLMVEVSDERGQGQQLGFQLLGPGTAR